MTVAPEVVRSAGAAPILVTDLPELVGQPVVVHGWVARTSRSKRGRTLYLRDRTGTVQVVQRGDDPPADQPLAELPAESAVRVTGVVTRYDDGTVVVAATSVDVLSLAHAPSPLTATASPDERMDRRYLDLRSPDRALVFAVLSTFEAATRDFLRSRGFLEIHTPKLTGGGNESGADVFEVSYFGDTAYLVQATQFYAQMAMAAGLGRVFEIGPVFRSERSVTPRHATEFTCIDFEMSWIDSHHDVMDMEEALLRHALRAIDEEHGPDIRRTFGVSVEVPEEPIPRVPFAEAREIARAAGADETEGRLTHREEGLLSRHALDVSGSSYVFVTDFPADDAKFCDMRSDGPVPTTRSFDLLLRGIEITTGDQPEHRYDVLRAQVDRSGIDPAERARYLEPYYLEMFRYGCPPHGGAGIGVSRFLMALLGQPSIRETTLVFRGPGRVVP